MPKVSTITVAFGRKIQTKPYENADASVSLALAFDHEEETRDIDDEISDAMKRAVSHVETTLGIANEEKPAPKKEVSKKEAPAPKKAAPKKPKPAAKTPEPEVSEEPDAPAYTKGDMMKAISGTMTALQKKGITDGSKRIETLVRGYLQDDKPPYSYARIPENSWADFIKDVEELKNAAD